MIKEISTDKPVAHVSQYIYKQRFYLQAQPELKPQECVPNNVFVLRKSLMSHLHGRFLESNDRHP